MVVAAVAAPVVKIGPQSLAEVVAVGPQSLAEVVAVVVAAAAVVAEAAGKELGAPQAPPGMRFATNSSVAALVPSETVAASLTGLLRTQVVVVALKRPRPTPRELDLPQPLQARRASAGECPESTVLPHWSLAIPCGT